MGIPRHGPLDRGAGRPLIHPTELVEAIREEGAAMERAKCAAEHVTRARARELIVRAYLLAISRDVEVDWRHTSKQPHAEAIADRLLAQGEKAADQAETGERA